MQFLPPKRDKQPNVFTNLLSARHFYDIKILIIRFATFLFLPYISFKNNKSVAGEYRS